MEIPKVLISRTEFKDLRQGLCTEHFYAEVVLIDRSNDAIPQVYQLKAGYISSLDPYTLRHDFHTYKKDAFLIIGELLKIDADQRNIYLTNDNLVTYKYLINFSGNEHPLELSTALNTLKDALLLESLNIKARISTESQSTTNNEVTTHTFSECSDESKTIDKIVQPRMGKNSDSFSNDITTTAKSRCQIQL
jgi:hypothetical protein